MSVEPKHRKLWNKLYTDTFSHEKIYMRTRPCKSKSCAEGRFFTLNTHVTVLRVCQTNDLWHDFVCEKLHTYKSSYVKICTWRRPRKSKLCRRTSFSEKLHIVTSHSWYDLYRHVALDEAMGNYVRNCTQTWLRVKICTRAWACKSKSDVEARLFTVNTVFWISKTNVLRHCFMCQKLDTEKGS